MHKTYTCYLVLCTCLLFAFRASSQNAQYAFRVIFTDKDQTSHSLSEPLSYLSQRALDRRSRYNITTDSSDLPVVQTYIDSVLQHCHGILHVSSRWQNSCVILLEDSAQALLLQDIPFVKNFKKVAYYSNGLHERPAVSDSAQPGGKPTGFDENFYGAAWPQIHLCRGEYLHQQGNMGAGKLIAVIDVGFTGVNTAHAFDSLFLQNRLLDTWNYIYDTAHVFDYGAHGCQVLSCMASYLPETHVGTAPQALYALYATDDLNSEQAIEEDNFAAAAERADSLGADLITTSLGYNSFDNPADSHTYSDLDGHTTIVARAANTATAKGIVVIASAGNEGNTSWQHILTPGDADSAFTIGSVTNMKVHATTSGKGPNAAGVLKPDVSGMGVAASVISTNGNVTQMSGTSFATPVIAGLTACLMQTAPSLTPAAVRSLIRSVSDSFAQPDNNIGNGVPDFGKAYDQITGITEPGRVDALFRVYPNPAQDEVFVSGNSSGSPLHFSLCDIRGRVILTGNIKPGAGIHTGNLRTGIYFLKLHDGKQFGVSKLMIR